VLRRPEPILGTDRPGYRLGDGHNGNVDDETDEEVDPEFGHVEQVEAGNGQEEPGDSVT
jgi:hypothetical protein